MTLKGATLLHVAAEFGNVAAARMLLDRGASVNARAWVDPAGVGGQTPIFHSATQFLDRGLPVTRLLLDHGADLTICVKLPGHVEQPDEVVECTVFGYALRFPGAAFRESNQRTLGLLRERGGRSTPVPIYRIRSDHRK